MNFEIIDIHEANKLIQEEKVVVVDIRDPQSFEEAHIPHAINLSNQNIQSFIDSTPKDNPIICCCYHGISSQNASEFLVSKGFSTVYSLEGGFEAWRQAYPSEGQ